MIFAAFLWTLTVILCIETVAGNLLVIFAFYLDKNVRQAGNFFIVSLAISDLIIGLEGFPVLTLYVIQGQRWVLGRYLCELWLCIDYTLCLVSILSVLMITIDRYFSVCYPAKYRKLQTVRKVKLTILLTWILPTLLFSLIMFGWEPWTGRPAYFLEDQKPVCLAPFLENPYVNMGLYVTYYWTVLVAMIILYRGIHKVARDLQDRGVAREKHNLALMSSQLKMAQVGFRMILSDSSDSNCLHPDHADPNHHRLSTIIERSHEDRSTIYSPELTLPTSGVAFSFSSDSITPIDYESDEVTRLPFCPRNCPHYGAMHEHVQRMESAQNLLTPDVNKEHVSPRRTSLAPSYNFDLLSCEEEDEMELANQSNQTRASFSWSEFLQNPSIILLRRRRITKAEKRAAKAFRIITFVVGAFALFWSPYYVVATIYGFCKSCVPDPIFITSYYMCYLNSSVNPFCYAFANRQLREVFVRILKGDWKQR